MKPPSLSYLFNLFRVFSFQHQNRKNLKPKPVKTFYIWGQWSYLALLTLLPVEGRRHFALLLTAQETSSWPAVRHSWIPAPLSIPTSPGKINPKDAEIPLTTGSVLWEPAVLHRSQIKLIWLKTRVLGLLHSWGSFLHLKAHNQCWLPIFLRNGVPPFPLSALAVGVWITDKVGCFFGISSFFQPVAKLEIIEIRLI